MIMAWCDRDLSLLDDDHIVYVENEYIRLGVNLSLGGAVTYLAELGKDNLINSCDWGRQIQMSFYSGPSPFHPEGYEVAPRWRGFPWNPIQSGDSYGHGSKVLDYHCENNEIYVKCIPMLWHLDNYPGECTFEVWYRLNKTRVEVTARLNNARPDTNQYLGTTELPAVYTNGVWHKLVSYVGCEPFTGGAVTEVCNRENGLGWPWVGVRATEYWTALVDDDNYGLGLYNDCTTRYICGFSGEPEDRGTGGPKDAPTGYMCPETRDILDHNIVYTYDYTLIVGTLAHIRENVYDIHKSDKTRYVFTDSREHFYYDGITDAGYPIQDCLIFDFKPEGSLCAPRIFRKKGDLTHILLDGAFTGGEIPVTVVASLYDGQAHERGYVYPTQSVSMTICGDGKRQIHDLDISAIDGHIIDFQIQFGAEGSAKVYSVELK